MSEQITTADELDALPVGSVVEPLEHVAVWQRIADRPGAWVRVGRTDLATPPLPAHVRYRPDAPVAAGATVTRGFTERQAKAWPEAIARAQRYAPQVTDDIHAADWTLSWADETRPGRGHFLDARWFDGENFVQIMMDVYGSPFVSVAGVEWLHSDGNEECGCEPCTAEREATR